MQNYKALILNPYPGKWSVVIVDNCVIHHKEKIRQLIEDECASGPYLWEGSTRQLTQSQLPMQLGDLGIAGISQMTTIILNSDVIMANLINLRCWKFTCDYAKKKNECSMIYAKPCRDIRLSQTFFGQHMIVLTDNIIAPGKPMIVISCVLLVQSNHRLSKSLTWQ